MEINRRFPVPSRGLRLALVVTRESHCLSALVRAVASGVLKKAEPALVLSNRSDLEGLASQTGLPFSVVSWADRLKAEQKALGILEEHGIDFIVLARFMKILS